MLVIWGLNKIQGSMMRVAKGLMKWKIVLIS